MTSSVTLLALDTSGPFASVAIFRDGRVISDSHAEMDRGQAEVLMPMAADLMAEAGVARADLNAIAVGTGPGNFTGLRVAVAGARGMALGLGIPSVGVSAFEVLVAASGAGAAAVLASLAAPRDQLYLQKIRGGQPWGAAWLGRVAQPGDGASGVGFVAGAEAEALAEALGVTPVHTPPFRTAPVIAALAADRLVAGDAQPRPAPLYIRAPDAAPARDVAPTILSAAPSPLQQ